MDRERASREGRMLNKYLQPRRYFRRMASLTASLSRPVTDYEAEDLTELVYQKTLAFNRNTTLDLHEGSERLLLAVSMTSARNAPGDPCRVLDFGGACGAHYKLATLLFDHTAFRWAVVETPSMVRKARPLETESLQFFEDIASAAAWLGKADLVNSNSVLQYLLDPLQTTKQLLALSPGFLLWERLMLSDGATHPGKQRTMLFNHGPGAVPPGFRNRPVLNDIIRLSRADFLAAHEAQYRLRCSAEESGFSTYLFSRRT
jgi:putative methyltransferase (TIGR04325 family)